ncbi:NtaA/DmoA family FMN-dependent monooxygenase [Nocardioides bruguierae]|uniref:NtaA/DmoA family FMN-dependent monooxygenase n=1 Tax=Nocardioides bruguierae TaxID=2945102 RepID=UPI002020FADF|nr:NtaA/DmoA family FMN-dependent monooxygenase [Nocardioides bruguierae]MCL8026226.1 NtaA/DmoA family FMN-dependent monooxygenase [Nocardioides bruguierae]
MTEKFHLGWFTNFAPPIWEGAFSGDIGSTWADGRFYMDFAKALDRAGFDYMMLEDSSMVSDAYEGTSRADLKHHLYAPKHDPLALAPLLASVTTNLGIVCTASTSFYPPYQLARAMSTLDHLSRGRIGWNIVTSSEDRAAQNYGLDHLYEHDARYDRADEFVEVVDKLWSSWEPDALVMNRETGHYVDHTKVSTIDHKGQFYSVRGPLNTLPSPQRRPVICQAGGSPRGRQFAAEHADTIITQSRGKERMKAYRDDIRARAEHAGRNPDDVKLLYIVNPVLGETDAEAQERRAAALAQTDKNVERALAHLSALTEVDFSQFDLDAPLTQDVETNGHRTTLAEFLRLGENGAKTLREAAAGWNINAVDLIGSVETVADQMQETMEFVGGDGFLISGPMTRQYISEVTDGLVPELQRRGLTRTSYEHTTFRDNLLSY